LAAPSRDGAAGRLSLTLHREQRWYHQNRRAAGSGPARRRQGDRM